MYRYSSTLSLASAIDGVGGQSDAPADLPPRKTLVTLCTGGWVGPMAGLYECGDEKKNLAQSGFHLRTDQQIANRYTD